MIHKGICSRHLIPSLFTETLTQPNQLTSGPLSLTLCAEWCTFHMFVIFRRSNTNLKLLARFFNFPHRIQHTKEVIMLKTN